MQNSCICCHNLRAALNLDHWSSILTQLWGNCRSTPPPPPPPPHTHTHHHHHHREERDEHKTKHANTAELHCVQTAVTDTGFEEGGFRRSTHLCAGENFGSHTHSEAHCLLNQQCLAPRHIGPSVQSLVMDS
jgi:hypothetical protein